MCRLALLPLALSASGLTSPDLSQLQLSGSVDQATIPWGGKQLYTFTVTLPEIPSNDKMGLTFAFHDSDGPPYTEQVTEMLHIYDVSLGSWDTGKVTIGQILGPDYTITNPPYTGSSSYSNCGFMPFCFGSTQDKAELILGDVQTAPGGPHTFPINVQTFSLNKLPTMDRNFTATMSTLNQSLSHVQVNVKGSGVASRGSTNFLNTFDDGKQYNLKTGEVKLMKYTITTSMQSGVLQFQLPYNLGYGIDSSISEMLSFGRPSVVFKDPDIAGMNNPVNILIVSTEGVHGNMVAHKLTYQFMNPMESTSKFKMQVQVPVMALKEGKISFWCRVAIPNFIPRYCKSGASYCSSKSSDFVESSFMSSYYGNPTMDITIGSEKLSYPTAAFTCTPSFLQTDVKVSALSAMLFRITCTLPGSSAGSLIYTHPLNPHLAVIGAVLEDPSTAVPQQPNSFLKGQKADIILGADSLTLSYDPVLNAGTSAMTVTVLVILQITSSAPSGFIPFLEGPVVVQGSPAQPRGGMAVIFEDIGSYGSGTYGYLRPGWTQGIGIKISLPPSFSTSGMTFQIHPRGSSYNGHKGALELAPLELHSVGRNLPCVGAASPQVTMSRSTEEGLFNDTGLLSLPGLCSGRMGEEESSFVARIIYKLPVQNYPNSQYCSCSSSSTSYCSYTGAVTPPCSVEWRGGLDLPGVALAIFKSDVTIDSGYHTYEKYTNFLGNPFSDPKVYQIGPSNNNVVEGSIFPVRYLLKIRRTNRGTFTFKANQNSSVGSIFKSMVCSMRVTHIGKNLGYRAAPEGLQDPFPTLRTEYAKNRLSWKGDWESKTSFMSIKLTNWAEKGHSLFDAPILDDDTLEVTVFYKIKDGSSKDGNVTRKVSSQISRAYSNYRDRRDYDRFIKTEEYEFSVAAQPSSGSEPVPVSTSPAPGPPTDSAPPNTMYVGVPKVISLQLIPPKKSQKKVSVKFINSNFDSGKYVDLCSIQLTKVGRNWPCMDAKTEHSFPTLPEDMVTDETGKIYYRYISMDLDPMGYYAYSTRVEEDRVQVPHRYPLIAF